MSGQVPTLIGTFVQSTLLLMGSVVLAAFAFGTLAIVSGQEVWQRRSVKVAGIVVGLTLMVVGHVAGGWVEHWIALR